VPSPVSCIIVLVSLLRILPLDVKNQPLSDKRGEYFYQACTIMINERGLPNKVEKTMAVDYSRVLKEIFLKTFRNGGHAHASACLRKRHVYFVL